MAGKLIYQDKSHSLLVRMDGVDKSIRNPIAFYHIALMQYRPDLELEVIVLFEKMLVFYRSNRLRQFEYQQDRLEAELHIKRTRLAKARAKLVNAKVLIEINPGKGKKIHYSIDKNRINEIIQFLYMMPEDMDSKAKTIKELQTFFNYYLNRKYLNEKIDQSISDEVHVGEYSIIGHDKRKIELGNQETPPA